MSDQGEQASMPAPKPLREGWEQGFAKMAARGGDVLLDGELPTGWDRTQWKW